MKRLKNFYLWIAFGGLCDLPKNPKISVGLAYICYPYFLVLKFKFYHRVHKPFSLEKIAIFALL